LALPEEKIGASLRRDASYAKPARTVRDVRASNRDNVQRISVFQQPKVVHGGSARLDHLRCQPIEIAYRRTLPRAGIFARSRKR
jgi:hypothetical protein